MQTEKLRSVLVTKAEEHSAVRHQIQRTGVTAIAGEGRRPHIGASARRQRDAVNVGTLTIVLREIHRI